MEPAEPALVRAFPALRERLLRHPFVSVPTPVEPIRLEGVPDGVVFVKRDDRSCPLYGGNKPRKLEYVIGDALARGSKRLVTSGGVGTHHGLATAVLGRAAGLATTLVLIPQPVTEGVKRSLLLDAAFGAELVYAPGGVPDAVVRGLAALARSAARGERPVVVPTGGSSSRGNLGFVSAGLELAEQVRGGEIPEPRAVYVAVGTGGTLAGLVAGLRLGGLATRVVGVLVTDILPPSKRSLRRSVRAVLARLRRLDPSVPRLEIAPDDFELLRDEVGPGYGSPTPASRAAVATAGAAGLRLETTYTGRCLASLLARARRGDLDGGPVLFWNTYNGIDVAAAAPRPPDAAALPPPLRALVDAPAVV